MLSLTALAQAQRGGMGFRGSSVPPARTGFVARPSGFGPGNFAPRPMPGGRIGPIAARPMPPARVIPPQGRVSLPGQRASFTQRGITFNAFHHRFHHRHRFFFNTCFDSFGNPFFCNNQFFSSCFNGFNNFNCVNPFLFNGFGLPFINTGFDPFFAADWQRPEPEQPAVAEEDSHSRELAAEVQELSDEIQSMRDEQRSREAQKSAPAPEAPKDTGPNAILVFRDGLQLPVRNYAISDDTIWVLDKPNQKIAISKLDIPATQQVNDKNGLEIHLPKK